jgi:hypothetical protein
LEVRHHASDPAPFDPDRGRDTAKGGAGTLDSWTLTV